jgi:hypothetical protein
VLQTPQILKRISAEIRVVPMEHEEFNTGFENPNGAEVNIMAWTRNRVRDSYKPPKRGIHRSSVGKELSYGTQSYEGNHQVGGPRSPPPLGRESRDAGSQPPRT